MGGIYETACGTCFVRYITAGPMLVAMQNSAGTTTYFLPDHLRSTSLLVDSSQTSVRTTRYLPFGETYQSTGTADNDHKFTSQRLDDASGIYHFGARYYDPLTGRFLTPDTIVQSPYDPQTLNRYTYARNNPVNLVDPDGHLFWAIVIGAAIGAGSSATIYSGVAGGKWTWQGFGQSLKAGAMSGAVSGAIGAGVAGSPFGQNVAFNVLGHMAGYSGVTAAQGGEITWAGLGGAFAGGVIGGALPGFRGVAGGNTKNAWAEMSYSSLRGAVSGATGGGVTSAINGEAIGSGVAAGAQTGAISGFANAALQIGLFGPAIAPSRRAQVGLRNMAETQGGFGSYGPVYRTGGWLGDSGLFRGLTLGRNLLIPDRADEIFVHETAHYYQVMRQGWGEALGRGMQEEWGMGWWKGKDPGRYPWTNEYQAQTAAEQYAP